MSGLKREDLEITEGEELPSQELEKSKERRIALKEDADIVRIDEMLKKRTKHLVEEAEFKNELVYFYEDEVDPIYVKLGSDAEFSDTTTSHLPDGYYDQHLIDDLFGGSVYVAKESDFHSVNLTSAIESDSLHYEQIEDSEA